MDVRKKLFLISGLLLFMFSGLLFSFENTSDNNGYETVRLQLKGEHAFQFAGYYAAKEKGFYTELGLDVHILEHNPKLSVIKQVISNEVQYGIGDTGIIVQYAQGSPIHALAAIFQHDPLVFVSKKSIGITNLGELEDKRIMVNGKINEFNSQEAIFRALLLHAGLSKDKVTLIPQSANFQDLIENKADVVSFNLTNQLFYLKNKKVEINLINPQNYGLDFYGDILYTSQTELTEHPNRVQRFRQASLKGWEYALENPEEIIQIIYKKYHSRSSVAHLRFEAEETSKLIQPDSIPLGEILFNRLRRIADTFTELKVTRNISDSELNRFIIELPQTVNLSPKEWQWLQQNPKIRLGIDQNFAPYEWLDENDEYKGITADYIRILETRLGVHFDIINGKQSWPDLLKAAKENKLDILFSLIKTPERATYLDFTEPYFISPAIIVTGQAQGYIGSLQRLNGKKVAIQKGHSTQELLSKYYPKISLILTNSIKEALKRVSEGKAHAYVGDAISASYMMKKEGFSNLMFSGQTEYKSEFRIGIPKENPELHSILTKALASISLEERNEVYHRWMGMKYSQGVKYKTIIKYIIGIFILFALFIYWIVRLHRSESALRRSETKLKAMFDAEPECIKVISADGKLLQMNPAGLVMFETQNNPSAIIGQQTENLIIPENRQAFRNMNERVHKGETEQLVYQIESLKGNRRWVETHAVPLIDPFSGKTSILAVTHDITEKKQADETIWKHANFDSLTNLPNRRMFHDLLLHEIKVSDRSGCPLALLFLDLDHFKEVNDELGHQIGDTLLQEAANRIISCVREIDIVSRLSGDEFTVILSELEGKLSVEHIAEKIIRILNKPFKLGNDLAYISASIGISIYPDDAKNINDLIADADSAMYTAKNAGRNRFSYFTQSMHAAELYRLQLIKELHIAIQKKQFQLRYQPIIELSTGFIKKVEVLISWNHPSRNLIGPDEFIPLAEESGLIIEIGDWIFKESIKQLSYWQKIFNTDIQISINKSPIEFNIRNDNYDWLHLLDKYNVSGKNIIVEITEGLLLDTSENVINRLKQYRDRGIRIAIDDFGTGYSALSYLKKFDIDYLKIDQSFTKKIVHDSCDMALTEAITVMAHKLGLEVIVEGIESIEQEKLLIKAECDFGQGYLFYKPMLAKDLENVFLSQEKTVVYFSKLNCQV